MKGSQLLLSVTTQDRQTEIAARWLESTSSATDGGRRSRSGNQREKLRFKHLPLLLSLLKAGVW